MFSGIKKFFTELPNYQRFRNKEARLKYADGLLSIGVAIFSGSILGMILLISTTPYSWLMLLLYAFTMAVGARFVLVSPEVYDAVHSEEKKP